MAARSRRTDAGLRVALLIGAALMVLAASVVLPRLADDLGVLLIPLVILAGVGILTLMVVPVHWIPAVALTVYALTPSRIVNQEGLLGALPLPAIILLAWLIRRVLTPPADAFPTGQSTNRRAPAKLLFSGGTLRVLAQVVALLFLCWSVFSLGRSSDPQTSLGWLISFSAGALLPLLIGDARREAAMLKNTWVVLGGTLGLYAALESALGTNPVWGLLYQLVGTTDSQHWSVYRAEASFGHPLFASIFFAIACVLAVGTWLTTRGRWMLLAAILSGVGLVATVSRGALLGAAIGIAFCYLGALLFRREKRWTKFAVLAVVAALGAVGLSQFDAFAERNDSLEGELSAQARDRALVVTLLAARLTGYIGSGPGTSGITGRLFDDVVIENSALQLLISVGIPGLLLFALLIGFVVLYALSRGAVAEAGGVLVYAICICGFNAIDAIRPMHYLLGALIIIALNPPLLNRTPDLPVLTDTSQTRSLRPSVMSSRRSVIIR